MRARRATSGVVRGYDRAMRFVGIDIRLIAFIAAAFGPAVFAAGKQGIDPLVRWPLEDAARALQFVRSKAKEWNLDTSRIAATGGSAGGCSSLYLLYHDDMADPQSADPVSRESTRLFCAAVEGAQTTLDPELLREWMPNYTYGGHAFGIVGADGKRDTGFPAFLSKRDELLPKINAYSPMAHVSQGDPPVFLLYENARAAMGKGESKEDPTHAPLLGVILMEKLAAEGVEGILVHPEMPHPKYKTSADYLIDRIMAK